MSMRLGFLKVALLAYGATTKVAPAPLSPEQIAELRATFGARW